MSKPRPDSTLDAQLDESQQALVIEWMLSAAGYHRIKERIKTEFAVDTSISALGRFWMKYGSAAILARRARAVSTADEVADEAKKKPGQFDAATIEQLRQKAFELSLNPNVNPKDVKAIFGLVLKARDQDLAEQNLALDRDKFIRETCELFLKWYGDEKARKIAESDAPNAKKIAQLRQTYFADVDELERSGEGQVPS
jgi:hypothetical protein